MLVTLSGMVIEVKEEQSLNAFSSILVTKQDISESSSGIIILPE